MNCEEFRRLAWPGDRGSGPEAGARRPRDGRAMGDGRAAGGGRGTGGGQASGDDLVGGGARARGDVRVPGGGRGPGEHPAVVDHRASGNDGIDAVLAAHLDVCPACGRWLDERMSEPPAGLLPIRLEVPSPTLRERSLSGVAAGTVSAIPPCHDGWGWETPPSAVAGQPTGTAPETPPSLPGWRNGTPVSSPGDGPVAPMSESPMGSPGSRREIAIPHHDRGPAVPWWEGWFRPWGQALALAGAAAVVLIALRTGPRLPDRAPGGHQPAPAVSLLAQVQFLDPADEAADLAPGDLPDDLSTEPGDDQTGDPGDPGYAGEDPTGLTAPDLNSSPFGSAVEGSFEIAVTDPAAEVSHEWSFLDMQEPDYTFLDDNEKEESWSEESRG